MKVLCACMFMVAVQLIFRRDKETVTPGRALPASHLITAVPGDTSDFRIQVQPILINRCSPCHFPGGKMYERLPFDKAETIVNNDVALLRRIKDLKEKDVIQKFIVGHKK